ncbi:MAG: hypothetical protein KQH57_14815 [Actinomycetales bacterium]|nr:hypothetical protein [Actinomycetales bacterium]
MTGQLALLVAAVALLVVLGVALVVVIRRDGRGRRTPPQSHRPWDSGTTVEPVR